MVRELFEKKEKKVEYVELIYDLIFVYFIRRSIALLNSTAEGGFIRPEAFLSYFVCTLAIIQIWMFTTYYINAFGRNSPRDHIFIFVNMFLLYFLTEGARHDWHDYHTAFHIAWALILVNIGLQYFIELRNHRDDKNQFTVAAHMGIFLMVQAVLVALTLVEFSLWHTSYLSVAAIVFGLAAMLISGKKGFCHIVDFEHLTERAMLYVVLTFGEMIIAVGSYFSDGFGIRNLYFAALSFLIVVGLFLSYGVMYDRIIDRSKKTNGVVYLLIHIFIILALNNITAALEFMREEEVSLNEKTVFLIGSYLMYLAFLFMMSIYAKENSRPKKGFFITAACMGVVYAALMWLLREQMFVNIAISVVFVFAVFVLLRITAAKAEKG